MLVLLAGLAVLALLYGMARHQISSRRAQVASLAAQTQQAQAKAARLTPYTSFLELREKRVQAVSELAQSRFDWAYAFHEFGRVLPPRRVDHLAQRRGRIGVLDPRPHAPRPPQPPARRRGSATSAAVTSATPPGSVPIFTLIGCTTSQSEVAQTLIRLRLINGVSKVTLQSSTKAGGGGSAAAAAHAPAAVPTFTVQVTFDPLPASPRRAIDHDRSASATATKKSEPPSPRHRPEARMKGRDRIVLIGLVLVVLAVVWLIVVSPERKQAARLNAQVGAASAQLATAQSQVASGRGAQARYAAAYASIVSLGKAVPPGEEVPSLIYQLAQASGQRNVEFSSITPAPAPAQRVGCRRHAPAALTGFTQMPFTFVFNGSFLDLYHLFQQLNRFTVRTASGDLQVSGRLLTIQSVKLAPVRAPAPARAPPNS